MEITNIVLIAVIVLFLFWRMMPTKGVKQITTAQLKRDLQNKGKQFIDVRTQGEFKGQHIKPFKNIPLHMMNESTMQKFSKEKEIVVICQSGMRSMKATKTLKKLGFKNITNVKGGINAWS